MLNFVKRLLGPSDSSDDSRSPSQPPKSNGSSSLSSNRRKSFPVVEIVVPARKPGSSSASAAGTPSSSRARSPASDRGTTRQASKKHGHMYAYFLTQASPSKTDILDAFPSSGANSAKQSQKPAPVPKSPVRRVSPELPLSPPKRTRFNEEIQYQNFTPYKLARKSLPSFSKSHSSPLNLSLTLSPPRPALSKSTASAGQTSKSLEIAGTASRRPSTSSIKASPHLEQLAPATKPKPATSTVTSPSGPARPTKRKRDESSDAKVHDVSAELEVAPLKAPKNAASSTSRAPNRTYGRSSDSKKTNGRARPTASTSKSIGAVTVNDLDDSSDDTGDEMLDRRSPSLELPEILPTNSPKKVAMHKVDVKGKGRALEPASTIAGEKVLRVPVEAKFRSLEELADFPPDVRPAYALWVLARCAILGSGIGKVTLDGIISRISDKYLYYRYLAYESGSDERIRLGNALKTAMKSKLCFVSSKETGGPDWYSVLEDVNPALKRCPARPKKDTIVPASPNGSIHNVPTNGSSSKSNSSEGPSAQTPKATLAPVPVILPPPRPPPRPKVPKITTLSPGDLPRAELDIFATSLLHLKNVPPPDEPTETDVDPNKAPPPKLPHVAVLAKRIQLDLHVPIRAAILGSPYRKLRMKALLEDIIWKYPQLAIKDDPDAVRKLQSTVGSVMNGRQCFFRVQRWSNRNASLWMVDRAIDPRKRKKKLKWNTKANPAKVVNNGPSGEGPIAGLMMNLVPPSSLAVPSASRSEATPAFLTGEMLLGIREESKGELEGIKKELDKLQAFYEERAEKWNRRLAYVHESEVVVVTTEPGDSSVDTTDVEEDTSAKLPSPELEEFIPWRKSPSKPNGTAVPVQKVVPAKAPHPLSKEVEIPVEAESKRCPSPSLSPSPPPAPPTYVCGYSDTRTGIICETHLPTREDREVHRRFAHGVKVTTSQHAGFLAEAKLKVKKQMEQERVNRKMSGKTGKKKLVSNASELALTARKNVTIKAIKAARKQGMQK